MKKAKAVTYKGIPANERGNVRYLRDFLSVNGTRPKQSPQKVWANLQKERQNAAKKREAEAAATARKERNNLKARKAHVRQEAIKAIRERICALGPVRDLLDGLKDGNTNVCGGDWSMEDCIGLAFESFMSHGKAIEQALCDLGILEDNDWGYLIDGERHSQMPKEPKQ